MRADGIVRKLDDLGRIYIPKEIRRQLFGTKCTDGEPMKIFIDGDNIILHKYEENKDDVCEWEHETQFEFATSKCGFMDTRRIKFMKLKYCPYCGKKIKWYDR